MQRSTAPWREGRRSNEVGRVLDHVVHRLGGHADAGETPVTGAVYCPAARPTARGSRSRPVPARARACVHSRRILVDQRLPIEDHPDRTSTLPRRNVGRGRALVSIARRMIVSPRLVVATNSSPVAVAVRAISVVGLTCGSRRSSGATTPLTTPPRPATRAVRGDARDQARSPRRRTSGGTNQA